MSGLDLAASLIVQLLLFERLNLGLGQDCAFLGNLGFQRLQAGFEVCKILAQPDRANGGWRDEDPQLAQLVGGARLPIGRKVGGGFDHGLLRCFIHPVC